MSTEWTIDDAFEAEHTVKLMATNYHLRNLSRALTNLQRKRVHEEIQYMFLEDQEEAESILHCEGYKSYVKAEPQWDALRGILFHFGVDPLFKEV